MKKINLLIVFGGTSSERSVSVWSANNVIKAIDPKKYILSLVFIDKFGTWYSVDNSTEINEKVIAKKLKTFDEAYLVLKNKKGVLFNMKKHTAKPIDICFPILHGINGEDGTIQGLLQLYNIKCVGCGVLGSCINMDKIVEKKILKADNIKITDFLYFHKNQLKDLKFLSIKKQLGLPVFIKPANGGSSIGSNKVSNEKEFEFAIKDAFKYDSKIIIEKFIKGREIECSVLGNENPQASLVGEVVSNEKFYSYLDKYVKADGAQLIAPAKLTQSQIKKLQATALKAYQALECRGFARVDMFLTANNDVYVNEINTIPGFTNISMFPRLWGVSGLSYGALIDRLIQEGCNI